MFDWVWQIIEQNQTPILLWVWFLNQSSKVELHASVGDFKCSSPGASLLIDEKPFSHIYTPGYTELTFLVAFYTTWNLDMWSVLLGLLNITSWCFQQVYWKPGEKETGKQWFSTDHVMPIKWCANCVTDQEFGNQMFNWVWLPIFRNQRFDCVQLAKI